MALAMTCVPWSALAQETKLPETFNFKRGFEAYQKDEYADAIDYLTKATAENAKDGYSHYFLACSYAEEGEKPKADVLSEVNLALKHLPKKDKDYRSRAYRLRAHVQMELNDTAKALDDLTLCISTDTEATAGLIDRADIYYSRDQFDLADADYREAVRRDESCTTAYMGLGRNELERKHYPEAEKLFSRVLLLDPSYTRACSFRSDAYIQQKKYREAASDIVQALSNSQVPDFKALSQMYVLADSAFVLIDTQLKAQALQEPQNDVWLYYQGSINESAGRHAEAIKVYKKYMEADPENNQSANYRIAQCYGECYNYPQALEYANAAVASDTTDADYTILRSHIYYNLDRKDEAMADANKTVGLAPDNPNAYGIRAQQLFLYGDFHKALDDYNTMASLLGDEASASVYVHRGRCYKALGDTAAARRDFEQAARLDTVPSEATSGIFALVYLGNKEKAYAWNDSILAATSEKMRDGMLYNAACLYAVGGDADKAMDYLRQALHDGYRDLVHMRYDSDMDALRAREDYKHLVEEYTAMYEEELKAANGSDGQAGRTADNYDKTVTEVPFTRESGIYKVKCTINGLPLHFYFDTGAADVTISSVEAAFMLKNGYLSSSDLGGRQYYGTASGDVAEGTIVTLRSVNFGGLTLHNVKASVVHSQQAPLLLGQSVLSRLGHIEIDYERNVLKITHYQKKVQP